MVAAGVFLTVLPFYLYMPSSTTLVEAYAFIARCVIAQAVAGSSSCSRDLEASRKILDTIVERVVVDMIHLLGKVSVVH